MTRTIAARLAKVAAQVKEAIGVAYSVGWLIADHVRRKLTGQPGLFEDLDFTIELDERDVMPPYDDPPIEEVRTKQTARNRKGTKGSP